ncbi:hypothetical protein OAV36_03910 [Flavobacteriales bacterium]|jgi:uncharacterized protein YqgV (UPF0045/DUF77 family)|nr:hypothetical protein [Flavobacteriales bacterium]MBT4881489.1 hypothetical protein [Flavobacteriales bacterium]MDC3306050.1 hypothetical protein [Flavobacteriales bacterium]MDC3395169.1 hypothetical protein [Flavobacteriales bacterium]MDG1348992.1 hypothetical protein [Flavobacteriales bacterium]|tara:strand:+ start:1378 stop:1638 length:261 start_codon:yes stop_codon:yes gene_type:complete
MDCSVEISMYPLKEDFKPSIIQFIKNLRKYPFVKVDTNGMSTQVFGDYKQVMNAINSEMESTFLNENSVVFTLKVINSDLEEKPSF